VSFPSARVSPETIIDIRPMATGERVTPNRDHYCLVVGATDMHQLHAELKAKGVHYVILTRRPLEDSTVVGWPEKIVDQPTSGGVPHGRGSRYLL